VDTEAKTGSILDRIVAARRAGLPRRQYRMPQAALRMAVKRASPVRDFAGALARDGINIIAELKQASPSRGRIRAEFRPPELAQELAAAGATALSVLTEEEFFQGSIAHLRAARAATHLPVLRKDFIFDPWQVWETRAAEADSFLLIAAILDDARLHELLAVGRELGMEPLVEVHTREEVERALQAGARILGVNNRDLRTFAVRVETSLELIEAIPEDCLAVSESGLRRAEDLQRLRQAGFDAFLVGEYLMESPAPAAALGALLGHEPCFG
jgi:indole-3-glycerol phosphate synthase